MNKSLKIGIAAVAALAVLAWLAFGFFGIHTAFIDDEVSEANPFADLATTSNATEPEATAPATSPPLVADEAMADDTMADETMTDDTATDDAMADDGGTAVEPTSVPETPTAEPVPQIVNLGTGQLIDHDHSGQGTVNVLSDGTQTFLRFEDDFAIDNGPDLNVYLVRGVDAVGPVGQFDDDFIDLGDLKGNIGAQNYVVDPSIDIEEYDTVVIWCVRFGVAFNAADIG